MPEDFKIRRMGDGHVLIILHPACKITKEAILALLAECGIDESVVTFLCPEEALDCSGIDDISVVIPIDHESYNAPELQEAGRKCCQAGGRIVILIGDSFVYEGLHPIADKYGTQCGWSAAQLDQCLQNPDSDPRNSDGKPVVRPKSEQVKC